MPVGKYPYIRYRIIDECLRSKNKNFWSMQDFLERLARKDICVSDRTVKTDLWFMRFDPQLGYNAPIKFCRRNIL